LRKLAVRGSEDPLATLDWVNLWALAVIRECGWQRGHGSPNGAAGIIPAVLHYYMRFGESRRRRCDRFL
jgi:L-serine dehydratase